MLYQPGKPDSAMIDHRAGNWEPVVALLVLRGLAVSRLARGPAEAPGMARPPNRTVVLDEFAQRQHLTRSGSDRRGTGLTKDPLWRGLTPGPSRAHRSRMCTTAGAV